MLTDRASQGPHYDEAKALRVSSKKVTVALVRGFNMSRLLSRYEQLTPRFQEFLKSVIGKDGTSGTEGLRNPDDVRTMTRRF